MRENYQLSQSNVLQKKKEASLSLVKIDGKQISKNKSVFLPVKRNAPVTQQFPIRALKQVATSC